ncbi:MAG: hypothetical protein ABSB13_16210, partial [Candidatus Binatus sp.]|uniref:hypothetical protein n=1 Tax=Candidatus Binatus sp. TaxID=2811406 RepID=UPI003D152CD5
DAMLETAIKRCGDYPEIIARTRRLAAWVRRQLGITPAMNDRIHQSRAAQPPRRRVPPGILN